MPAVGVMTERFVTAAELMRRVLGMPEHGFAVIGHPVSSASDDQLRQMARVTLEAAQRLLTGRNEP